MNIYQNPPEHLIKPLLAACDLPVDDLGVAKFEHFFGCGTADKLDGVVGLELYGDTALLRSLAVVQGARGLGLGKRLLAVAEAYAMQRGVNEIYLLTTTARGLFESLGYQMAARESAPPAIAATSQFSSLCPASASFMFKRFAAGVSVG